MNIKELRNKIGISQQELANATGISKARIEKWEVGKGSPKVDDYLTLKKFFGISDDENEPDLEIDKEGLLKESGLASIASNVKIDYVMAMLAEIQEKLDNEKKASIIVSKVQKLAQLDFENKLKKLRL